MSAPLRRNDDVIQVQASGDVIAFLSQAAASRGQTLTEFMLESARCQAQEAMLAQPMFFQDEQSQTEFLALLESLPKPFTRVRARSTREAACER
jgi:uncharacterized protein (DUF1778 family)